MSQSDFVHPNYLDLLPEDCREKAKALVEKALAAGYYAIGICEGYKRVYCEDGQFEDDKGKFEYEVADIDLFDLVGVNPETKRMEFLNTEM